MNLRCAAAGDLLIGRGLYQPTRGIYRHISSADFAIGNLEVALTSQMAAASKLIALKACPRVARDIAAIGFQALSLANNHAMDFGPAGLEESIAAVRGAGMRPVGAGRNLSESLNAEVFELEGGKVAVIGVSATLPNGTGAAEKRAGVAPVRVTCRYVIDPVTFEESPGMSPFVETQAVPDDVEALCSSIAIASSKVDLLIVSIHWGVPLGWVAQHQDEIAQYQPLLGRAMIDAGAAAIIGHHPHAIQPVEFYNGAPILYSIGNFLMHDILPDGPSALTAHPRYDWSSLKTRWNDLGCVARLDWSGDASPLCRLLITKLDANGEPEVADKSDAVALLERIGPASRIRGCEVSLEPYMDCWSLRLTPSIVEHSMPS